MWLKGVTQGPMARPIQVPRAVPIWEPKAARMPVLERADSQIGLGVFSGWF
jgi:hypothetical protein